MSGHRAGRRGSSVTEWSGIGNAEHLPWCRGPTSYIMHANHISVFERNRLKRFLRDLEIEGDCMGRALAFGCFLALWPLISPSSSYADCRIHHKMKTQDPWPNTLRISTWRQKTVRPRARPFQAWDLRCRAVGTPEKTVLNSPFS